MQSRKREKPKENENAMVTGLNALREEIRKMQKTIGGEKKAIEEEMDIVLEEAPLETEVRKLKEEVRELTTKFNDLKEFVFENNTGARAFIQQDEIKEAMLEIGSADFWKNKAVEELPAGLSMGQTMLNETRCFSAAKELQGLIEVAEAAREVVLVAPAAAPWIKKGLEDATGTVLRTGKERKGQGVFWLCLQKHLIKRMADKEKEATSIKGKASEPAKTSKAEFPCINCFKAGKPNQLHTLVECAKAGNTCWLECHNCPIDIETNSVPLHWRERCPTLRKRDRSSSSRNPGNGQ